MTWVTSKNLPEVICEKKTDNYKPLKINQKQKFSHWNYGFQSRIFFILVGTYPFQVNSKDTKLLYPLLQSLYQ